MKISVIVPCFDVEAYVDDCLASLVGQSYENLDVVVVDDGSTDGTSERIARWSERDGRVQLIRQANGGLGAARNTGLAAAHGDAIFFLDGDDRLPTDALRDLAASAESSGSDIVCGAIHVTTSSGSWRATQQRRPYDHDRRCTHLFELEELVYDPMVCGKLFRRAFWDEHGLAFREGALFEDVEVMMAAHCFARSIDVIAAPSYWWRRREDGPPSITQSRRDATAVRHRFVALERADRILEVNAPESVWVEHGVKVLHVDLREQGRLLLDAEGSFVEAFMGAAAPLLAGLAPGACDRASPMMQLVRARVLAGDAASVTAAIELFSGHGARSSRARLRPLIRLFRRAPMPTLSTGWRMLAARRRRHSVPSRSTAPPSTTMS